MPFDSGRACYVHIPFCVRKCAYCDFNSYSGYTSKLIVRYVNALEKEINAVKNPAPIDTIFFGGGTPTAIPATDQVRLLNAVLNKFEHCSDIEITTEANPGSSDVIGLSILRDAGFNRISFGVQAFDDELLRILDRIHSADEAFRAIAAARQAGFDNISIDLMFGLPNQTVEQWKKTLDTGLSLGVQHISLYNLIVEEGTGFATLAKKGRLPLPDNDTMAEMYQMAIDAARQTGMVQYEISNFAVPGKECGHNIHYWQNEEYYGFGAGAVAYENGVRRTNIKRPVPYCSAIESGLDLSEDLDSSSTAVRMSETMMLGLRMTTNGVSYFRFIDYFKEDLRDRWSLEIKKYASYGLLDVMEDRVRLTERGIFMANDVMAAFL
jgi:oxygen-independent coproporphyrinogen-3 oxidase